MYHLTNHYFLGVKWHLLAPTDCTDCSGFESQDVSGVIFLVNKLIYIVDLKCCFILL